MGKRYQRNRETYVVGSNAVAYKQSVNHQEIAPVAPVETRQRKKKVASINPACTFILASVIIAVSIVCVFMLKAQFSVVDTSKQIMTLKNELNEIRRTNANITAEINETMNLNEIKRIAMDEYGMVYPKGVDVIDLEPEPTSYTVQYSSIELPKDEKVTFGNMLAFITRGW
ncbi:MAG: septum formation initiator family protein [Vallitaleaceae bacterium]|nr:septum formation initiator family protein [Vallitaleaceae bacterium]